MMVWSNVRVNGFCFVEEASGFQVWREGATGLLIADIKGDYSSDTLSAENTLELFLFFQEKNKSDCVEVIFGNVKNIYDRKNPQVKFQKETIIIIVRENDYLLENDKLKV